MQEVSETHTTHSLTAGGWDMGWAGWFRCSCGIGLGPARGEDRSIQHSNGELCYYYYCCCVAEVMGFECGMSDGR